jgi:antitoxin component YwqK of YwqJK toxin-antitoxin module
MKYKKVSNNENAIEIGGKVVLSFDPRYKEYLKWRDNSPELEKKLVEELEQEIENKRLYNNGAPHVVGKRSMWYREDGILKISAEMKGDKYHGGVIQYTKNGTIKSNENFVDGVLDGKYKYYYGDGKLRQIGSMKNHVKEGEIMSYWETGNLQSIENLKNGLRHGLLKRYRMDKTIVMTGQYDNNYRYGNWIWYYVDGKKMKEELYKKSPGFPVPTLKKRINWLEGGQKVSEIEHEDTLNHGKYIVWYKNGNKKQHSIYKSNKLDGKWIEWHRNGIKRAEGNMLYDKMEGKWTFWYHNGKKELECDFDFGEAINSARIYHDSGLLKQEVKL